jgi:hypothetical protein
MNSLPLLKEIGIQSLFVSIQIKIDQIVCDRPNIAVTKFTQICLLIILFYFLFFQVGTELCDSGCGRQYHFTIRCCSKSHQVQIFHTYSKVEGDSNWNIVEKRRRR